MTDSGGSLVTAYAAVKPSVVAIVARVSRSPDLPDILGTGFVASRDGLVVTNDHVIRAITTLPRLKGSPLEEWPALVMLLHNIPGVGIVSVMADIIGAVEMGPVSGTSYLGPDSRMDLGLLKVNLVDLPAVDMSRARTGFSEGEQVAVAGYPMGSSLLKAPGWLHQLTPTLRTGIIAAVLPFPCPNPHGLLLDVASQGGSSGSLIFDPADGAPMGVLYGGAMDVTTIPGTPLTVSVSAALSFAVPSHVVAGVVEQAAKLPELMGEDRPTRSMADVIKDGLESGDYRGTAEAVSEDAVEHPNPEA